MRNKDNYNRNDGTGRTGGNGRKDIYGRDIAFVYVDSLKDGTQKTSGLKYDSDKPKIGMVINYFCNAIKIVADIGTYGSKKYGKEGTHWDHNWLEVKEGKERYTDALFRHYLAYANGEWLDAESGHPHLGHCAWNVLALLELEIRGK